MKRFLLMTLLLLLPCTALAEADYTLTATVAVEESALLALPIDGAETVLPLVTGDALTITVLGTSYCEAVVGESVGYIATADIAFDMLNGEPTHLMVIDCSPTNQYHGRITLRTEASTKSKAIRKVEKGCIVLVLGTEGDMTHIALPDTEGYVVSKYMDEVEPVSEYRIAYVDPGVNAWLRLDSRSGKNWRICTLDPGTPVQFISNPNGWASVEVAGYRGRMLAHNLTFDAPEE
ncbi:MAG: SH3 domain-containing protein [Clostridia bacterium]|nr:SH3 domain-containing protein [Clostridia bacterium]